MTDLPDILARATPKVKPLVWEPCEPWKECSKERAKAFGGEYQIVLLDPKDDALPSLYFEIGLGAFMFRFEQDQDPLGLPGETCPRKFPSVDAAKAAAQADYEARILSAIEPQDTQLAAALIEARKALVVALDDLDEWVGCKTSLEKAGFNMDDTAQRAEMCREALTRIDAIMNPGGGALKGD